MLAAPALGGAAELPAIKSRLTSGFPKSLDTIHGGAEGLAKKVAAVTGGKFQIQVFAAGEIVPGPGVLGHTCSYYFVSKDPTFAFDTAMLFGLNSRQPSAWMSEGGGLELMREFFRDYNIYQIPTGNTGAQMGDCFRSRLQVSTYVRFKQWASLPKKCQAIFEAACADAHVVMQAKYDMRNPASLKRLVGGGVQLHAFPNEVLVAG